MFTNFFYNHINAGQNGKASKPNICIENAQKGKGVKEIFHTTACFVSVNRVSKFISLTNIILLGIDEFTIPCPNSRKDPIPTTFEI